MDDRRSVHSFMFDPDPEIIPESKSHNRIFSKIHHLVLDGESFEQVTIRVCDVPNKIIEFETRPLKIFLNKSAFQDAELAKEVYDRRGDVKMDVLFSLKVEGVVKREAKLVINPTIISAVENTFSFY